MSEIPPGDLVMVRVLGPVDLVTTQGVTSAGSRYGRMLLAALAVSANHMTPADQLAHILWGDDPPPSRDNTLQSYVARLRHLIGHDRIRSEDHSYGLHLTPDELDALLFERKVAEAGEARAHPANCSALCKEAISLWRGPPFGDFAELEPFRLEAIRLDELRLFAMEMAIEGEIAIGHEEMVVGTLRSLVSEYPYRERMWYLLSAALSRAGRRVEALRACSELRATLAEAGIEPTAELQQLEADILSEAPAVRPRQPFGQAHQVG